MAMGPSGVGSALPKFGFLDSLASDGVSAYVVEEKTKKGQQTLEAHTTGWMAFKSGVNRVFHFKSDSDKATNQATLQHLLRDIEASSSTRVASEVRNSDVFTRALQRGTYVSSELVGKLRDIANEAAQKELDDKNFMTFANFLDRGREIDLGHDHVQFTEVDSNGLTDLVDDLASGAKSRDDGSWPADGFPKTYAMMKELVHSSTGESRLGQIARLHVMDQQIDREGNFVYGPDHPVMQGLKKVDSPIMQKLATLLHETAAKATERGERVTDAMLAKTAADFITHDKVMASLVKEVNTNRLGELVDDPTKVSGIVRQLEEAADQGKLGNIRKEDVVWLADALTQDQDVDMPIPKLRGRRSDREAEWPIEAFEPKALAGALTAKVVKGTVPPKSELQDLDLQGLRQFTDKTLRFSRQELTDGDLAPELLRDEADGKPSVLLQVLQQRRAGLDAIARHDAMVRDQREKLVGSKVAQFRDLPSVPLGRSKSEEMHVEDVRGFVKAVALDPIGQAKRVQLADAGVTDPDTVGRGVVAEQEKWEGRLDKLMPALDRFADLGRRLDDIAAKGGLKSLDRTMWKNIQEEARSLQEAVPQIKQLAEDLDKDYGDVPVLRQLAAALESAAEQIEGDIAAGGLATLHDDLSSSTNDRMFGQLPPLKVLQHEQFLQRKTELDGYLAGLQADIEAILDDLETVRGEDAPKSEPKPRPTPPATGKTPGETVLNALGAAFNDAGHAESLPDGADEAFGKWVATSGRFIDRYAEFAVRHENISQLRHLEAEQRTEEETQQVTRFLHEVVAMRDEVGGFARSTAELRKAAGASPPPEVARLLEVLDASVAHMQDALDRVSFVRTSRGEMHATVEDRLMHTNSQSVARFTNLLVALSPGDLHQSIKDDGVGAMMAVDQLPVFERGMSALMARSPTVQRDEDRDALGTLDIRAERLVRYGEGLSSLLDRVDQMRTEVAEDRALIPIGPPLGNDATTAKANALKQLDRAHNDLRLQLQTLRTTMADYQLYRGAADPTARYAGALRTMSQALTTGSTPREGWATYGNRVFASLIDSHINEHGMEVLSHQMKPGLAAIDKLGPFKAGVQATLGGDRQPTERELANLRDGVEDMRQARSELALLRDQARVLERAITKGETFDDYLEHRPLSTFHGLPGAHAWQNFETVLSRALAEIDAVIEDADGRIGKASPQRMAPILPGGEADGLSIDAGGRSPKSTNPFDEDGVRPRPTNPFDEDGVRPKSTNPFDEDGVRPKSTNPFST